MGFTEPVSFLLDLNPSPQALSVLLLLCQRIVTKKGAQGRGSLLLKNNQICRASSFVTGAGAFSLTPVPGTEMAQLVCAGCRTLLMYTRAATSVRCSCCSTVNLAPVPTQYAHVNCGSCRTMLMYPYGAPSVKCAVCHYVTNVGMANARLPIPMHRPNGTAYSGTTPSTSTSMPYSQSQTVVVENPRTIDESGKLVSNVVVGVTTDKK
nr:protein lol2 [Quercus suber]